MQLIFAAVLPGREGQIAGSCGICGRWRMPGPDIESDTKRKRKRLHGMWHMPAGAEKCRRY